MQFNETLFVLTFGADVPCAVSRHVSIVPTLRVRLLLRSSESRTQDGLGRWLISPGVGLRVGF
jgi:hypothetical protein